MCRHLLRHGNNPRNNRECKKLKRATSLHHHHRPRLLRHLPPKTARRSNAPPNSHAELGRPSFVAKIIRVNLLDLVVSDRRYAHFRIDHQFREIRTIDEHNLRVNMGNVFTRLC